MTVFDTLMAVPSFQFLTNAAEKDTFFRTRNPCVAIVEPAILDVDRRSKMATIEDGDINSNGENPSFKNILCVYNIIIWIPGPSDSRQKFVAEIGLIFQIVKKIRGRS